MGHLSRVDRTGWKRVARQGFAMSTITNATIRDARVAKGLYLFETVKIKYRGVVYVCTTWYDMRDGSWVYNCPALNVRFRYYRTRGQAIKALCVNIKIYHND